MADTTGITQTPNIGLYTPNYTNIADIAVLNENFILLDKANARETTLYVDASASTAGDGSQEKPFKTIQEAIDRGYMASGVIYINIAEGTYNERITTPRTPANTWRFTGTGSVVLQGALFDDCNYLVLQNLTFSVPTGTVADYAVQVANCNNCAIIDCMINGQATMTSLIVNNSRARLQNIKINNGGIAIGANNNSYVFAHQTSGTNNAVGLHADGAIINVIKNDIVATTPYVRLSGGIINTENGDQAYPSNFTPRKFIGDYANVDELRARLMAEMQALGVGESIACYFGNNLADGFGIYSANQRMQVDITRSTDYGNGYGTCIFRSHHDSTPLGFMRIQDGSFVDAFPMEIGGSVTGSIMPYLGSDIPAGYLPCEGAPISRTTYAKLFAVIGTKYGEGDGSMTFNLPNLIGKFLEGSAQAGEIKGAGLPNINGILEISHGVVVDGFSGAFNDTTELVDKWGGTKDSDPNYKHTITFNASDSNSIYGASETVQPPAVTVKYCIKY